MDGSGPFGTLEALKSDPSSSAAILDDVAAGMLASCPNDKQLASARFVAAVMASPHLIAQLWRVSEIQFRARTAFADYVSRSGQPEGAAITDAPKGQGRSAAPETISVGGQTAIARSGHAAGAPNAEPINGGGHPGHAQKASPGLLPSVDPKSSDGGLSSRAAQARMTPPPSARPQSEVDIRGAALAAKHIARTVLDTVRAPDGKALGDIRYSEINRYRSESLSLAAVLDRIQAHAQPAPGEDPIIRDMITADTAERFMGVRNAA